MRIEQPRPPSATGSDVRIGMQATSLRQAVLDHLYYSLGRPPIVARPHDYYRALALAIRDRMQHRWISTSQTYFDLNRKVACYLSAEFLMGPHLGNNLVNLHLEQEARKAMADLGHDLDTILACEGEPGLGNGGLGRLAACYLDSLATLQCPAIGYGIRYEFGIFEQEIRDGWQAEITDKWLSRGNPWEIAKPDVFYYVNWGGHTEYYRDETGCQRVRWIPHRVVKGVAYDTPIQGYGVNTCNTLRLWGAEAVESFDFQAFNVGDYYQAVNEKLVSETVTKVLYPNDEPAIGKRLRLAQQYFFVTCSLQDMLRLLDLADAPVESFAERFAVQLNDTHPSIGVAELMRLLVDERRLDWDEAWAITVASFGYTNHTLLPEALETWPLPMFAELLPRHLEIIYEINRRFLDEVRSRFPGRRGARGADVPDRRGRRQTGAHGPSRCCWQSRRQWCRGTSYRTAPSQYTQGFPRALARAFQQQDQRCHPAPFPGPVKSGPEGITRSYARPTMADGTGPAAQARCSLQRRRLSARLARRKTRQQAAPRILHPDANRDRDRSRLAV